MLVVDIFSILLGAPPLFKVFELLIDFNSPGLAIYNFHQTQNSLQIQNENVVSNELFFLCSQHL